MFKRRGIIITTIIVLLALAGGGAFAYLHHKNADKIRNPNSVSYAPPTKEEQKETEQFKQQQQADNSNPTPPPTTAPDGRKSVTPTISYAGQYDALFEASAFVPSIFEDGGTCTLTLVHGSKTVTKTSAAVKDATTTRCNLFSFASSELTPSGTWTASVAYSSATAVGTSKSVDITIK